MDRRLMLLRSQPFSTAESRGVLTPDELRGPAYRRLAHGAHQPAEDEVGHGRLVQAFRATHDHPFVLMGRSAAWAHGSRLAQPWEPVVVAVPSAHRLHRTRAQVPHVTPLGAEDVVMTALGPATTPARTAVDLARGAGARGSSLDDRVAAVDALLRASGLTVVEARDAVGSAARLHGLPAARRVVELCRDGVDSPPETRLRLLVLRAGLPEPTTQCPVRVDGRTVARLDLGWPGARVGCEYDGADHLRPDQVRRDLRRHNAVRAAGWVVLQVDRHQMARPDEVLRQLRDLLLR